MVVDDRFGKPFDFVLVAGPQTERGGNLGDLQGVAPVVAETVFLLADSPLRDIAFAATDNFTRKLESWTPAGEPTYLGSFGVLTLRFRGPQIASDYFGPHIGALLLRSWAAGELDPLDARERVSAAATASRLGDVDALMSSLLRREDGRQRLGEFAEEVTKAIGKRTPKARKIAEVMKGFAETFSARTSAALREARDTAELSSGSFVASVTAIMRDAIDRNGPRAGAAVAEAGIDSIDALRSELNGQRDDLRERLEQAEHGLEPAAKALEAAAARSHTGLMFGIQGVFKRYLTTASDVYGLRYAYGLTDLALVTISKLQEALNTMQAQANWLEQAMLSASESCLRRTSEFEARKPTRVEEITDRPLFRERELRELYSRVTGATWGAVAENAAASIRAGVGGFSHWLDHDPEDISADVVAACGTVLDPVRAMTADDAVRWLSDNGLREPALVLRDARAMAPVLARFDRTRYVQDDADEEAAVIMLGVPSAEKSVFAGTPHVTLVSTGDPARIVFMVLKLGFPASSLWHYPDYKEANDRVRAGGHIAHLIYPGFRDDPPPAKRRPRRPRS
jgi:hypothetical protein